MLLKNNLIPNTLKIWLVLSLYCPNGAFTWTYRFFESVIFKAIPIIEEYSPNYEGYYYYKKGDDFIYNEDWVNSNLEKLKKEMML